MRTIYHNAQVYTGQPPLQQAFIVEDDRFVFAGSNAEALAQPAEAIVDLGGAFVCAGFNDSHMHLLNYGQTLTIAPLGQHTKSLTDMLGCLAETTPGRGGWILGRGWNQDFFTDAARMPNRWDLDQVSTEHPICATRACGHALVVNSKALAMLGITADTPQIEGGRIVMEEGVPNGVFFDNAMDLIFSALPAPGKEDVKNMLRAASRALNSYGITSCQSDDYCVFQGLPWQIVNEALGELEASGELTVRVYEQANFTRLEELAQFVEAGNRTGAGTEMFRIGPLKLLGDGALGARTAYLSRPYADDPSTVGLSVFTPEAFDQLIGYAHAQGMQVAVHCIGDACLDLVLGSLEKALAAHPRADHRHGIVHCQITRPDQLDKIVKNHLHVYAQSIFLDYDLHIVEQRVGKDLAESSYNWKTLLQRGVTVSNGSDCPVELPRVLAGIQCAVTRRDLRGVGPYLEREAFTVQEALDSFTQAGAWASFEENIKGRIAPGMLADFVVLGNNPFDTAPDALKDIPILHTFLGGRMIYSA
ncbi:MAG: amidohydrolase [Oscillospiraceae bacterium]|nr:amidohydrolase [Oscillospiraceae bacterium]